MSGSQHIVRISHEFPAGPWPSWVREGIDAIFWETAGSPPTDATARARFQHRWLGQYLEHDADHVFVALDHNRREFARSRVLGYLTASRVDPAQSPRFADLPYVKAFATVTAAAPAHLHINLTAGARGQGIGAALIEACVDHMSALREPALHVVTGATARNVSFYGRCGFVERARYTAAAPASAAVVCLVRSLHNL